MAKIALHINSLGTLPKRIIHEETNYDRWPRENRRAVKIQTEDSLLFRRMVYTLLFRCPGFYQEVVLKRPIEGLIDE